MSKSGVKVIVTGGAGFIGAHIVDAAVARGDEVHVIDNYAGGKYENRINPQAMYHELDICEYEEIAPLFKGVTYVFHEAALPRVQFSIEHPLETFAVNVMGAVTMLKAAHEGGAKKVVLASSGSVYGDQETLPYVETMTPSPKSPYALQKHMSEQAARVWSEIYGLPTVSLRYFNVYGPRMDPKGPYALAIGKFLLQKKEGKPLTIWGDGTHTRDFTHVSDVVRVNLLAAESPKVGKGEVLNVGAGRNVSVLDMAAMIGGPTVHEPERLEPAHARSDSARARSLLGWEPQVSLEEGIALLKKDFGIS